MGTIKSINLNAGHNAAGKVACGVVGLINESKENRAVASVVSRELKKAGVKVYNTTVDDAINQKKNLSSIIAKCNQHNTDLDVFIHFNSGANNKKGNGRTTGTEVLVYSLSKLKTKVSKAIRHEICKLGYKDRGTKVTKNLYVLRKSKNPAILIECCFVDDKDDVKLYNAETMGKAIAKAILSI